MKQQQKSGPCKFKSQSLLCKTNTDTRNPRRVGGGRTHEPSGRHAVTLPTHSLTRAHNDSPETEYVASSLILSPLSRNADKLDRGRTGNVSYLILLFLAASPVTNRFRTESHPFPCFATCCQETNIRPLPVPEDPISLLQLDSESNCHKMNTL